MAELLSASRYYYEADGLDSLPIFEVTGLNAEVKAAGHSTIGSGKGGDGLRQATPAGRETYSDVTIKMYATNEKKLFDWYRACSTNAGRASDWSANRKASSVTVYDQAGEMQARWEMKNSFPVKYELATLKVDDSNLLLETIVICHEGVERVQ